MFKLWLGKGGEEKESGTWDLGRQLDRERAGLRAWWPVYIPPHILIFNYPTATFKVCHQETVGERENSWVKKNKPKTKPDKTKEKPLSLITKLTNGNKNNDKIQIPK